jgi:hypothetical protein
MAEHTTRLVHGNRIVSPALPSAQITIDPAFTYVGGPRFELYGIAHAEQHLFVDADGQPALGRVVWVQFEGFLPTNQRTYRYPVTETVDIGGMPFIYDASSLDIDAALAERPDSDLAAARTFLQAQGYHLAGTVLAQRFVHLIEPDKRHELMIIYGESSGAGASTEREATRTRALASFTVRFL